MYEKSERIKVADEGECVCEKRERRKGAKSKPCCEKKVFGVNLRKKLLKGGWCGQ